MSANLHLNFFIPTTSPLQPLWLKLPSLVRCFTMTELRISGPTQGAYAPRTQIFETRIIVTRKLWTIEPPTLTHYGQTLNINNCLPEFWVRYLSGWLSLLSKNLEGLVLAVRCWVGSVEGLGSLHVFVWGVLSLSFSVLWYCWLGLLTCKNRLPYNLYCVGGDVKHCTIQSNHSLVPSAISFC